MDQVRFAKGLQPSCVEVAGCRCSMFFTLRAALAIEARFEKPYLDVVLDILQAPGEDGKPRAPVSLQDQAALVAILMAEAGQEVAEEDLLNLHMVDFSKLCRAAQAEILLKMPEGSKKKQESQANGTGGALSTARGKPWGSPWKSSSGFLRRFFTGFWKRRQKKTSRP